MRLITEPEFVERLHQKLSDPEILWASWVTGPGRSGAIASSYASYWLNLPYVPWSAIHLPEGDPLVIDILPKSAGRARKDLRRYKNHQPVSCILFDEVPCASLWFEIQRVHEEARTA